jgi:hypothetical protein
MLAQQTSIGRKYILLQYAPVMCPYKFLKCDSDFMKSVQNSV